MVFKHWPVKLKNKESPSGQLAGFLLSKVMVGDRAQPQGSHSLSAVLPSITVYSPAGCSVSLCSSEKTIMVPCRPGVTIRCNEVCRMLAPYSTHGKQCISGLLARAD